MRQTLIEMRGIATIVNVLPVENDEGQSVLVSIVEALANVRPQPLYTWLFSPPGSDSVLWRYQAGTQYRVMIREQHGIFTLAALLRSGSIILTALPFMEVAVSFMDGGFSAIYRSSAVIDGDSGAADAPSGLLF